MTEQEMLEAARYIAKRDDEMYALMAAVAALESRIDRLNIANSQALLLLEKAHRAAEGWELLPNCRDYIAQAMEILAND